MNKKSRDAIDALLVLKELLDGGATLVLTLPIPAIKRTICLNIGNDVYHVKVLADFAEREVWGVSDFRVAFSDMIATAQALHTSSDLLDDALESHP